MIRMQSMARIMLVTLGIYICLQILSLMPGFLFAWTTGDWENILSSIVGLVLAGLLITLSIKWLIMNSQHFAQRIISSEPPQEALPEIDWLTAAFRLLCIGAGIFYLVRFAIGITQFMVTFSILFDLPSQTPSGYARINTGYRFWMQIFHPLCTLPIALYLLCGAPHFVRWQVRKTLDICRKVDTSGSEQPELRS